METKNLVDLPASSSSTYKCENNDVQNSCCGPSEVDSPPGNSELKESKLVGKILGSEGEVGDKNSKILLGTDSDKCLVDNPSILQVGNGLTETIVENLNCVISGVHTENGSIDVKDGSPINNLKRDGSPGSSYKIDGSSTSSVKRARLTVDERQSSVHVTYNSLTRASKQKLQELLQQWSEWDAHYCSLSHDSTDALESGEETHFPALHVGSDKRSAVAFWIDNQTKNQHSKEFIPLDSNSIPLYDRGFSLGLASADGSTNLNRSLEIVDASRCFNCGSYSHSLKECPKPRDNTAVNNARKKHKSRRSQKASSRNPTRYYQNSPGGKYDGLSPGVLGAETRQLLGLGELDPPPWLNRMREIGYPPGYLDPEGEDQPSGIMIFADEEQKEEKEDGEILEIDNPEPPLKMSVEFPGINAPIPENADERRWASRPSNFDQSRNRSHRRFHHSSESIGTGRYHEQRRFTDYRDEGPPGTSNYPQRHGGYDSSYTPYSSRGNIPVPRSPSLRSPLDRGRWSPSVHEASPSHGSYSPVLYTPSRLLSPQRYDSSSSENWDRDTWNDFNPNSSSHHNDHHDISRRHSRR